MKCRITKNEEKKEFIAERREHTNGSEWTAFASSGSISFVIAEIERAIADEAGSYLFDFASGAEITLKISTTPKTKLMLEVSAASKPMANQSTNL